MAVGNTRQESAMMKFSQTPRRSVLALVAVATLGNVLVTDASARGFGGGGFGGARNFGGVSRGIGGGGQLGGLRQAGLPAAIHAPLGGIHVPSGAGLQPIHPGGTIQAPPSFHPPGAGLQPIHPGATIQPPSGGIHVPPGLGQLPNQPGGGTIQPPSGGVRVPPLSLGQLNQPGGAIQPPSGGINVPPGLGQVPNPHVSPAPQPPQLSPTQPPRLIDPPPSGNAVSQSPPAYSPAPVGGSASGTDDPTVGVAAIAALVGNMASAQASNTAATVQAAPVSYTPVSGPICDRFLRNGCYLAMRKYSIANGGAELRCTMICE
jgi:hypothetical protein